MGRSVLAFLLAVCCCMCQDFAPQTIPAVVREVCPSVEEREAIREQITEQVLSLLSSSSYANCCQVHTAV